MWYVCGVKPDIFKHDNDEIFSFLNIFFPRHFHFLINSSPIIFIPKKVLPKAFLFLNKFFPGHFFYVPMYGMVHAICFCVCVYV